MAARRYFAASTAERSAAGHWLNFVAKSKDGVFVQEVRDFGLAFAPILLPAICLMMLSKHTEPSTIMHTYVKNSEGVVDFLSIFPFEARLLSTPMAAALLTFIVFPIMKRRGWSMSPYYHFGGGYVCMLAAFSLSLFVEKMIKNASSPVHYDRSRGGYICEGCLSQWVLLPHSILFAFAGALTIPAGIHIVYIESGRHLRTLAIATWLALNYIPFPRIVGYDEYPFDINSGADKFYGYLGAMGFVLFLISMRSYTPREQRVPINNASRLMREAENAKFK
ncbi:hypothetical protein BGZ73_000470 [Actinomortierella ambigua]|nr:hypothetical protein BGZ73_000470 [Actinomortierella ambigua]